MRFFGRTYSNIKNVERERDRLRFALNTIVNGSFGDPPPRDIRTARRIAFKALMEERYTR